MDCKEDKSQYITEIINSLIEGDDKAAELIITERYPFSPISPVKRNFSRLQATRIFFRDGFVDRYTGCKLVFPRVLRLISKKLPIAFPYHQNWKMDSCHTAFWELYPVLDHVVPIARGGNDIESNLVCTSSIMNSAKLNWTLEELEWQLHPAGDWHVWDGLVGVFTKYMDFHKELLEDRVLKDWYAPATVILKEGCR